MIIKSQKPNTVVAFEANKKNQQSENFKKMSPVIQGGSPSFGNTAAAFNLFSLLEAKPILSLMTVNLFGMLIPRTLTELYRNKKELGHFNWNAGRERLIDEISSTFTLFFAPGLLFNYIGNKLLNSKFNPLGVNTKAFTDYKMLDIINNKVKDVLLTESLKGNTQMPINDLRQAVARGILEDTKAASSNLKFSTELIDDVVKEVGSSMQRANMDKYIKNFVKNETRAEFKQALSAAKEQVLKEAAEKGIANPSKAEVGREAYKRAMESLKDVMQKATSQAQRNFLERRDRGIASFIEKFIPKASEHLRETDITIKGGKAAKDLTTNTNNLIRDIFTATDDILMKAAKGKDKVNLPEMSNNTQNIMQSLKNLKLGKVLLPFTIVLTLLMLFPKLNIWLTQKITGKKEFPGLAGLNTDSSTPADNKDKTKPADNKDTQSNTANTPATNAPPATPVSQPTTPVITPPMPMPYPMPYPVNTMPYQIPQRIVTIPYNIPFTPPPITPTPPPGPMIKKESIFAEFERRMQS